MKTLKALLLTTALLIISNLCFCQTTNQASTQKVFTFVEQMPQFPGGESAMQKFMIKHLKYPHKARRKKIEGKVYLQFIVEVDGSIDEIKALRELGGGCTESAIKALKKMPKWIPGKQNGKEVRVEFTLPVNFQLAK